MDVDPKTLLRLISEKESISYSEYYKKYSAGGKASLRRAQFRLAQKNAAMAIWLGKQYLGQRDRDEEARAEGAERLMRVIYDYGDAS